MERKLNRFGPNIAKFRQNRNWTQENWQRCNITRQILADIEKQCCGRDRCANRFLPRFRDGQQPKLCKMILVKYAFWSF